MTLVNWATKTPATFAGHGEDGVREGLFGTRVPDQFNDGVRMDRFFGTSWFYRQEALNKDKASGGA